jgi:hypothetical protein
MPASKQVNAEQNESQDINQPRPFTAFIGFVTTLLE